MEMNSKFEYESRTRKKETDLVRQLIREQLGSFRQTAFLSYVDGYHYANTSIV